MAHRPSYCLGREYTFSSQTHLTPLFTRPGTGKTVTVIESIRQILVKNPNARILACAPSNSASDLIATRLSVLSPEELFRFYAPSRHKNKTPDELRKYACITDDGHFSAPPVATLKRFRVIVSTCVSASFAHGVGMPRGHFTHIFVDEAGQATEPEVMIGIKTMADNDTNIVLSGDPKQLGPIIRSAVARELGLEKSYLARLTERDVYNEATGQGITYVILFLRLDNESITEWVSRVVKLIQNYRSHPSILDFPNRQFYGAALRPCGNPRVINSYLNWPKLVNKKFPIIFHALSGQDDREASSPSFFNILESLQVKDYVQELRASATFPISMTILRLSPTLELTYSLLLTADAEIGVITPYYAQSRKIRVTLKGVADGVKVGSVEEFQGQVRIMLSSIYS